MSREIKKNSCRICGCKNASFIGTINSLPGYGVFDIFNCSDCGCRFTWRQQKYIFEEIHAGPDNFYSNHVKWASAVKKYFDMRNLVGLRKYLSKMTKFKFIINNIPVRENVKIAELGCSLGYLSAFFILSGCDIQGLDISETAVKKASSYFGDSFSVLNDEFFAKFSGYFDFVFHLGTIGCVDDPIEFTNKSLRLLKPKGKLLFNSPDTKALKSESSAWGEFSLPPDLITIFSETFWSRFSNSAEVNISYEPYEHRLNCSKHLKNIFRGSRMLALPLIALLYCLSRVNLIYRYPMEYGTFVTMIKK